MRTAYTAVVSALIAVSGLSAMAAPEYLIDARGWDGRETARLVVRAIPELTLPEAWTGGVAVTADDIKRVAAAQRTGLRA